MEKAANKREAREESGREMLKRHRWELKGKVIRIPETWGHEETLTNCADIDRSLFPAGLLSAREAMVEECRADSLSRALVGWSVELNKAF